MLNEWPKETETGYEISGRVITEHIRKVKRDGKERKGTREKQNVERKD
jgi:hypothetical protein